MIKEGYISGKAIGVHTNDPTLRQFGTTSCSHVNVDIRKLSDTEEVVYSKNFVICSDYRTALREAINNCRKSIYTHTSNLNELTDKLITYAGSL